MKDWGPSPEQRYEKKEMGSILSKVIEQLEPIYRAVFVLRDVEEISTEDTAEMLGISISAVKSRLLRARLKLREMLHPVFSREYRTVNCKGLIAELTEYLDGALEAPASHRAGTAFDEVQEVPGGSEHDAQDD